MKKLLSMILAILMIATLSSAAVISVAASTDEEIEFDEGRGTEEEPYLIASVADFEKMAAYVIEVPGAPGTYFKQSADIDFAGATIKPIGANADGDDVNFKGVYDGAGYKIKNFTINSTVAVNSAKAAGLFGGVNSGAACIKNVNVVGATVNVGEASHIGAIAGYVTGAAQILSCTVDSTSTVTGVTMVGGIAGRITDGGLAKYCVNDAAVTATYSGTDHVFAGGIVGRTNSENEKISYCVNNGAVSVNVNSTSSSQIAAGGIKGFGPGSVENCYNTANISSVNEGSRTVAAGGITGRFKAGATITNCYSTAATITGIANADNAVCVGLIHGVTTADGTNKSTLTNCYALAASGVTGKTVATAATSTLANLSTDHSDYTRYTVLATGENDAPTCDVLATTDDDYTTAKQSFDAAIAAIDAKIAEEKVVPPTPVEPDNGEGTGDGQTPSGGEDNQTPTGGDNGQAPTGGNDNQAPADGNAEDTTKAAETTAPAADEGCGSMVGAAAVVLVVMTAGATAICAKRKED